MRRFLAAVSLCGFALFSLAGVAQTEYYGSDSLALCCSLWDTG